MTVNTSTELNAQNNRLEAENLFRPLYEESTCLRDMEFSDDICPNGLQSLLERSRELFIRACRLENMLRGDTPEAIPALN